MKITFVDLKSQFNGWSFGWIKTMPLISQLYLGTILKNNGHNVEILKESLREITLNDFKDSDFICFSGMSSQVPGIQKWVRLIKENYPDKKIIVGGVHATFRPEDFPLADYVVVGEGENIILDLISGKIRRRIVKGSEVDLNKLPFSDYSLVKDIKKPKIVAFSTSRGCPFNCNFCTASQMFGKKYRFRDPDNVIEELQSIKNAKLALFYDDNFCVNKERAKEILRKKIDNSIDIKWWGETRVDIANDDELLKLIAESNNFQIAIGFESINPRVLEYLNKGQKFEDIVRCIKKLYDYGIKITGFFIAGTDEYEKDAFLKIYDFSRKYELDYTTFSVVTPFPGSDLYNEMNQQNRLLTNNWGAYDTQHVVFKPKNMSAYDLQSRQLEILKKYYLSFRGFKFWLGNLFDSANFWKGLKELAKQNREHLEFLKKADPR